MPRRMSSSCAAQMTRKLIQPSGESPTNPPSVSEASPGQTFSTSSWTAWEARKVWMPYHAMPTMARTIAGIWAPMTPKLSRASTG